MSLLEKWLKIQKSGHFKRQKKKNYLSVLNKSPEHSCKHVVFNSAGNGKHKLPINNIKAVEELLDRDNENSPVNFNIVSENNDEQQVVFDNWLTELDDENNSKENKDIDFRRNLHDWSLKFKIRHNALKDLLKIIKTRLPQVTLPTDPRTFLQTPDVILLRQVGDEGQYWHQGLEFSLTQFLSGIRLPGVLSININMDGLPLYRSFRDEFWPILFNIYELPDIAPMIIDIYYGKSKPKDLHAFLGPFVEEMKKLVNNGITLNKQNVKVKIRCFICDSPARAFVKNVANFNAQNGCQKCTVVGEYSYISHCNYFPRINCLKRTDAGFRTRIYGSHHKERNSPLLELPVDMVQDFPVADSLHLIDLGLMKRCLIGWRDGNIGSFKTKWSARDIVNISNFLLQCKLPKEIHRSMRSLDCLPFWKGLEFRTFFYYVGIVILKTYLPVDAYQHFLLLFCAITICSCEEYSSLLDLAETLLENYVEYFRDIYGEDYMTSNIHNLCHVVDDVRRFGKLQSFSAYPFENKLYQLKNMIRTGNKPLIQIAKRMGELIQQQNHVELRNNNYLKLKKEIFPKDRSHISCIEKIQYFSGVQLETFVLENDMYNKWFLTTDNKIVYLKYVIKKNNNSISLWGCSLKSIRPFFENPIRSTHLNIYCSNCEENLPEEYKLSNIKCKIVATMNPENDNIVFIPLLHTL